MFNRVLSALNHSSDPWRLRDLAPVILACVFATVVFYVRSDLLGYRSFAFLGWNLLLALTPLVIAWPTTRRLFGVQLLLWWSFFPNAPYLMTDLIHLKQREAPLWLDLGLFSSFGWAGLVAGIVSFRWMQTRVLEKTNRYVTSIFVFLVALSTGFAIWIGRFLRINSWDPFTQPGQTIVKIVQALAEGQYVQALGVTCLFGAFVFVVQSSDWRHRDILIPRRKIDPSDVFTSL